MTRFALSRFPALARKYTDFSELTAPMILEFVDKILVHKPDYSGGGRVMTVDVYLKFIGNFEIPAQELTPEKIAEQERVKAKREASRLRHKRYRDRKRREKLEAERNAVEKDTDGENS